MSAAVMLVLLGVCAVVACTVMLIFHRDYEDGLIGRLALALICIGALTRMAKLLDEVPDVVSPIQVVTWTGLGLFFIRHSWRFMRNVAVGKRAASSVETAGKAHHFRLGQRRL